MVEVKQYHLPPTSLIPNSPFPLLHYPGLLSKSTLLTTKDTTLTTTPSPPLVSASATHALFARNGWSTQWIFRYGPTQQSHYHSRTHECMAVLSGTAHILFGVADAELEANNANIHPNNESNSSSSSAPHNGIILPANPGDVFIIPAGVSHKTHRACPEAEFKLLTPGDGHGIDSTNRDDGGDDDVSVMLEKIELDGFTMMGAYPMGGEWDFAVGGEDEGGFKRVWAVERPERDPVLGGAVEGLCGLWSRGGV